MYENFEQPKKTDIIDEFDQRELLNVTEKITKLQGDLATTKRYHAESENASISGELAGLIQYRDAIRRRLEERGIVIGGEDKDGHTSLAA